MHLATINEAETCASGASGDVIPVDIASSKAVAIARPLRETERLPLLQAQGRILARQVLASIVVCVKFCKIGKPMVDAGILLFDRDDHSLHSRLRGQTCVVLSAVKAGPQAHRRRRR